MVRNKQCRSVYILFVWSGVVNRWHWIKIGYCFQRKKFFVVLFSLGWTLWIYTVSEYYRKQVRTRETIIIREMEINSTIFHPASTWTNKYLFDDDISDYSQSLWSEWIHCLIFRKDVEKSFHICQYKKRTRASICVCISVWLHRATTECVCVCLNIYGYSTEGFQITTIYLVLLFFAAAVVCNGMNVTVKLCYFYLWTFNFDL